MIWAIRTTRKATDITSASLSLRVSVFTRVCNMLISSLFQFLDVGVVRFGDQILRVHAKMYVSELTECLGAFMLWSVLLSLRNCMDSRQI